MSDSLRPHRPIEWSLVLTLVAMIVGGVTAFVVVREQGERNKDAIAEKSEVDRDQDDRIRAIENNRSIEKQLADLKNEVVRLSALIESRDGKRKR